MRCVSRMDTQARTLHVIIFSAPFLPSSKHNSRHHYHTRYLLSRSFFTDKHNALSLFSEYYFLFFFFS